MTPEIAAQIDNSKDENGFILKQIPEDFIVKEVNQFPQKESGRFIILKATKKLLNTLDVTKQLAKQLNIREKQIGFAGSKDKRAITEQFISIPVICKGKIPEINIPGLTLEPITYADEPITLGSLQSNYFEITIRNLEQDTHTPKTITHVENYFDEQRFSTSNAKIGKAIITKQFNKATELIDNQHVQQHLINSPNDHIGALKELPLRLLKMYVHAYQSYLWNQTLVSFLLQNHGPQIEKKVSYSEGTFQFLENPTKIEEPTIPLLGFDSGKDISPLLKPIVNQLLTDENITFNDFIIKQIPELTLEGDTRNTVIPISDLTISKLESDDLNSDKLKTTLMFTLPKGSYATLVIKRLFC